MNTRIETQTSFNTDRFLSRLAALSLTLALVSAGLAFWATASADSESPIAAAVELADQ